MSKRGTLTRGTGYIVAALSLAALVMAATRGAGSPPTGGGTGTASSVRSRALAQAADDRTGCSTDTTLCLSQGRFLVDATWTKPDGESGIAHAVPMTADSGYFWLLEPGNVELGVKTLNG